MSNTYKTTKGLNLGFSFLPEPDEDEEDYLINHEKIVLRWLEEIEQLELEELEALEQQTGYEQ